MAVQRRKAPPLASTEVTQEANVKTHTATIADLSSGHLGVTLSDADENIGVLVADTDPNDLAAAAGLRTGFVITSINGVAVTGHEDALNLMQSSAKITMTYLTEAEAAVEAKKMRAKYVTKRNKWIVGIIMAVAAALVAAVTTAIIKDPHEASKLATHLGFPQVAHKLYEFGLPPPPAPLQGAELELKKAEAKYAVDELLRKYPHMALQYKMKIKEFQVKRSEEVPAACSSNPDRPPLPLCTCVAGST